MSEVRQIEKVQRYETKADPAKEVCTWRGMTRVKVLNVVAICSGSIRWTGWGLFVWSVL